MARPSPSFTWLGSASEAIPSLFASTAAITEMLSTVTGTSGFLSAATAAAVSGPLSSARALTGLCWTFELLPTGANGPGPDALPTSSLALKDVQTAPVSGPLPDAHMRTRGLLSRSCKVPPKRSKRAAEFSGQALSSVVGSSQPPRDTFASNEPAEG